MTPEDLISKLVESFPDAGLECRVDKGHAVVDVAVGQLFNLIQGLKDSPEYAFDMLMDMTTVDWQERVPRFDMVYHLYSVEHNHRLRIKSGVEDGQLVPTLTGLYPIADWQERELWDLYGIRFKDHPNLKRLMMYDEFKGHPLRKDYPYDKRQPLLEETWPVRESQVQSDVKIHRP